MQAPQPIYIGCDPAFRKGGFWAAILDEDKRMTFKSFDLLTWHDWLRSDEAPAVCFVLVENSALQKALFYTHKSPTGALLTPKQAKYIAGAQKLSKAELISAAMQVGKNQAVSELAYQSAVGRYGERFAHQISPKDKGQKIIDDRTFEGIMRQEGIELMQVVKKQDQRDAAKVALIMRRKVRLEGMMTINEPEVHYNPGNY